MKLETSDIMDQAIVKKFICVPRGRGSRFLLSVAHGFPHEPAAKSAQHAWQDLR